MDRMRFVILRCLLGLVLTLAVAPAHAVLCKSKHGRLTVRDACHRKETPLTLGDITAVTAGAGLQGGGTDGDVTVALDLAFTDGRYWRLDGNAGTHPGTHFLGTTDDQPLELHAGGQRTLRLEPDPTSPNVIAGHSANAVNGTPAGVTISGGGRADGPNEVAADFATVPGGFGATANFFGQMAYANGFFATPGDAQSSVYLLRNVTTTGSFTELFLDGTSQRLAFLAGRSIALDISVVARASNGQSAAYFFQTMFEQNTSSATINGLAAVQAREDVAAWDAQLTFGSPGIALFVLGEAGKTIRWVATVRATEVVFP